MKENNELSIVIINYKTPQLTLNCLRSIYQDNSVELEVVVVDNFSNDNSEEIVKNEFPHVNWINVNYNSGFSRGCNIGIRNTKGSYILLLNSDTEVKNGFFSSFLSFYKSKDKNGKLGLLGCRLVGLNDGDLLVGSGKGFEEFKKVFKNNPLLYSLNKSKWSLPSSYESNKMHYSNHEIDYVSGGCVLIKRSKIEHEDLLLDEDFFLYSEDVEWSYRVKKKGYFNYFCGDLEVFHVNAGSTKELKSDFKKNQILLSRLLFILKCYGLMGFLGYAIMLKTNLFMHYLISLKVRILNKQNYKLDTVWETTNALLNKYFFKIIWRYYFKIGKQEYLKYEATKS